MPASRRAASMRTERMGSVSSGAARRTRSCGGSGSSARTASRRTSASLSPSAACTAGSEEGVRYSGSRLSAVARAMPGFVGVRDQRSQRFLCVRQSATAGIDRFDEVRFLPAVGTVPLHDRLGGPAVGLVLVALIAGVRSSVGDREIGTRHAEAVIAPDIDHHVGVRRHVAVDAQRAGAVGLVMMVLLAAELRQRMTLAANRVQAHRAAACAL